MHRGRILRWLFEPVDNTALILFRVLFGLLCFLESAGAIATGWVRENLVEPTVQFPLIGFEWARPLPGWGMYAYFALMAACALLVMLGRWFRPALAAFTLLWTGTYLMQTVSYNNHYYLLILLCLLLLPTPADAWLSLDARRDPTRRGVTCPRWCLAMFQAQIAIVYSFAALAKLDADWLAGRPLRIWLNAKTDYFLIGPLYDEAWLRWAMVYGGILFDALVVPLLLWRRTRLLAVALAVVFHLFNSFTFRIGIFPYLGIGFCLFFFPGEALRRRFLPHKPPAASAAPRVGSRERWIAAALGAYLAVQILLPLRHLLYAGPVHWTEEGHRMAWRMMLRTKSGTITFRVRETASGREWAVDAREHLSAKQAARLATHPELIWQFAQHLRRHYAAQGVAPIEVYAGGRVSLNGRRAQPLVDPRVDLAAQPWPLLSAVPWIVPLQEEAR